MRLHALALLLALLVFASCVPWHRIHEGDFPLEVDDAGVDAGAVDVDELGPDVGTEAGAPVDVARVEAGAPCIPACAGGMRCEGGACVAFDAGTDAGFDVPPLSDAALATLFRTCEPVGSECAPGVRCMSGYTDGGTRGVCSLPCENNDPCNAAATALGRRGHCAGVGTGPGRRGCVLVCGDGCPGDGGYGRCEVVGGSLGFCGP